MEHILIVGSGIAGLAAAGACVRAGWPVQLVDKAAALSEAGAGIQLGPNATRLLDSWGLGAALRQRALRPDALRVRSAATGDLLASLPLGDAALARYGSDYLTLHRADLQELLLAQGSGLGIQTRLDFAIDSIAATAGNTWASGPNGLKTEALAVLAADGVWSACRGAVPAATAPRFTGHWAWRSLLPIRALPSGVKPTDITVWLGKRLHVVGYPVRAPGLQEVVYNLVVLLEQSGAPSDAAATRSWSVQAEGQDLLALVGAANSELLELLRAAPSFKRWALYDQAPLSGPEQMAQGRVALLGDAAHAMLPYLAQGAAMALEDAAVLEQCLSRVKPGDSDQLPSALAEYAGKRWQRAARVQARAQRNARVFHASGLLRWGRDAALGLLGPRLMDMPWLYAPNRWLSAMN